MSAGAILRSLITCPYCGAAHEETMPTDACIYFYECTACRTVIRPKPEDCCVFCSFGTIPCPPVQVSWPCRGDGPTGEPMTTSESAWIDGIDLRNAGAGPFHALLLRIGEVAGTSDRRTIAASFALRFGWSSAMAIAPYLQSRWVPDIALDNVSFGFSRSTAFERAALRDLRGVVVAGDPRAVAASVSTVPDADALRRALRDALVAQAAPVVAALERWSGFAPRGTWGQLTSAWAAQFTTIAGPRDEQRELISELDAFFAGDDIVAAMRPRMHAVSVDGATRLYQRRASCCRLYLLPGGELCASCPLVGDDERLARNRAWMRSQMAR